MYKKLILQKKKKTNVKEISHSFTLHFVKNVKRQNRVVVWEQSYIGGFLKKSFLKINIFL